jgi:hypothetical protein
MVLPIFVEHTIAHVQSHSQAIFSKLSKIAVEGTKIESGPGAGEGNDMG